MRRRCALESRGALLCPCPKAAWHSVGSRAGQQRDCLQCGNVEVQHRNRKFEIVPCCVMASKSKLERSEREMSVKK